MPRVSTQLTGAAAASCRRHHQRHSSFLSGPRGNPRVSQETQTSREGEATILAGQGGAESLGGARRLHQMGKEGTPSLLARVPFPDTGAVEGKHPGKAGDGVGPVGCSGCNIWKLLLHQTRPPASGPCQARLSESGIQQVPGELLLFSR